MLSGERDSLLLPFTLHSPNPLGMASLDADAGELPSLHALTLSLTPATPSASTSNTPAPPQSSSSAVPSPPAALDGRRDHASAANEPFGITYRAYRGEEDMDVIVALVDDELSEPYNLYTYRYFLDDWCVQSATFSRAPVPARRRVP